jgi:hypothetical protein
MKFPQAIELLNRAQDASAKAKGSQLNTNVLVSPYEPTPAVVALVLQQWC